METRKTQEAPREQTGTHFILHRPFTTNESTRLNRARLDMPAPFILLSSAEICRGISAPPDLHFLQAHLVNSIHDNSMVPGDKNVLATPAAWSCFLANVIFINETISYTPLPFTRFSISFHFFCLSLSLSSPFFFFNFAFSFSKRMGQKVAQTSWWHQPAAGTVFTCYYTQSGEERFLFRHVHWYAPDFFLINFTTLRNLVPCTFMQNLSSPLLFHSLFPLTYRAQRSAPFFFLLLIGATKRTFLLNRRTTVTGLSGIHYFEKQCK